ncbi:alginate O-acetyltransferase AlgX-related protein [Methylobacter marinus]|uniref:alginate O-acetyltransferase AlgX-related protein n=1 Tax=Methylobacter marinus TaxID=34058 RepID=UPI000380F7A7|nr:hypothetical protein [Methylobacter marinus]
MRHKLITGFFILLIFVPLIFQLIGFKSDVAEKRALAQMPEFSLNNLYQKNFYSQVDNFLNDHSASRGYAIKFKNWIDYRIFNISPAPAVFIGKEGWMYYKTTLGDYLDDSCTAREKMRLIAQRLGELKTVIEASGRRFIFTIIPNKATVYPEYVGLDINPSRCGKSHYDLLVEALEGYNIDNFVKIDHLLNEAKEDVLVYYKTDSHWTDEGALIAINALFKKLDPVSWDQYLPKFDLVEAKYKGDLLGMFGWNIQGEEEVTRKIKVKDDLYIKEEKTNYLNNGYPYVRYTENNRKEGKIFPRTFIYRDSYMVEPFKILKSSFKELDAAWPIEDNKFNVPTNSFNEKKDLLAADIIILEVVERSSAYLNIDIDKMLDALKTKPMTVGDQAEDVSRKMKRNLNDYLEKVEFSNLSFVGKIRVDLPVEKKQLTKYIVFSKGWSMQENWGIWSLGKRSVFIFSKPDKSFIGIRLKGQYYNGDEKTRVRVNGKFVGNFVLTDQIIRINSSDLYDEYIRIELEHLNPVFPHALGQSNDAREIKYGLTGIELISGF